MQETQAQSLGWEDALEKEMAIHCSIPACEILQREEPGGLQFMGLQRVGHNLATEQPLRSFKESGMIWFLFGGNYSGYHVIIWKNANKLDGDKLGSCWNSPGRRWWWLRPRCLRCQGASKIKSPHDIEWRRGVLRLTLISSCFSPLTITSQALGSQKKGVENNNFRCSH